VIETDPIHTLPEPGRAVEVGPGRPGHDLVVGRVEVKFHFQLSIIDADCVATKTGLAARSLPREHRLAIHMN
jgi:hypothetical protein